MSEMMMLLVATPIPSIGDKSTECDLCPATVYDHAENIERVRNSDGFIICPTCAILLKMEFPDKFPRVEGQMWQGHIREPQPHENWKPFLDFLNHKKGPMK